NRLQTHLINITSQPENPIYFIDQSDTIMTVTMFSNLDALAYLGLSVTILVSGLNLLVSTSNSIMNRKHSFYLLRLAGTPLSLLKKTIMIEALTPLLATILLSALVGAGFGIAFLQMLINQGAGAYGYKIVGPEPTYYIFIVGSVALCVLLVISTFATLDTSTGLQRNRQE